MMNGAPYREHTKDVFSREDGEDPVASGCKTDFIEIAVKEMQQAFPLSPTGEGGREGPRQG